MVAIQGKNSKTYISPGTYVSDEISSQVYISGNQKYVGTIKSLKTNLGDMTMKEREWLLDKVWHRFALTRLYRDVLDDNRSIRVVRHDDDEFVVETYEEYGWWIFKMKSPHRTKYIFKENKVIDMDVVYE